PPVVMLEILEREVAPEEGVALVAGQDAARAAQVALVDPGVVASVLLLDHQQAVAAEVLGLGEAEEGPAASVDLLVDDVERAVGDAVASAMDAKGDGADRRIVEH